MPSLSTMITPFRFAHKWLASRLAADRDRRGAAATAEFIDMLRHAHFNRHKYRTTLYMRSGRTIIGRMGVDDHVHEAYHRDQGSLVMFPDAPAAEATFSMVHLRGAPAANSVANAGRGDR